MNVTKVLRRQMSCCHWFTPSPGKERIWQVDPSTIKYGRGALREVGQDCKNFGLRRVAVYTDKDQVNLPHVHAVLESLKGNGIDFALYSDVKVEPTDESFRTAIKFAQGGNFDGFISVGGGSVMDTTKAANLYSSFPPNDFLDYVNPPIGGGKEPPAPLKKHIACPTTCGTGSEVTGLAIFDLLSMKAKTGIATRAIRPTLAVVDPDVTKTMPAAVIAASGFDVLSHACESYTARPYTTRPYPDNPSKRPMSQGANPYSDIGCEKALQLTGQYITRAVHDPSDDEAREKMMFASTLAGIAFGNVGCHLPHGLSYSVSGLVKDYKVPGYPQDEPMVPHGFSVIVNAPSVFRFTADACPDRHLKAAELLGANVQHVAPKDAGEALAQQIMQLMKAARYTPSGLNEIGYSLSDVPNLVKGAMPQKRLLDNAPKPVTQEDVTKIYQGAMKYW